MDVFDYGGGLLIDNIVLADGTQYTFQYEPTPDPNSQYPPGSTTGRLTSVTLPTGATVSYSYLGPNHGIVCSDGTTAGFTRTTPDGTWTYVRSVSGTSSTTTVTDPQGNQTIYNFQGAYETERQIYQGSASAGTLLKIIISCYNGNNANCNGTPISQPITQQNVFLQFPNGQMAEKAVFVAGQTGLIQEVDEYDFGAEIPGPLKRKTLMQYAPLGNHILNRLATVTVYDGANTQVSQIGYSYDETPVVATSALPQHVGVTGARGNQTSVQEWLNTTNRNILTTSVFDDAGNVLSVNDPGGHLTSLTYGCNGAYATSIALPDTTSPGLAHHTVARGYDCNTGLLLNSTDQNNQTTSFAYDNMYRSTQIDFPDGGQTLFSYPSPTQRTVQNKIDNSRFTSATTLTDVYGRTSRTEVANGESVPYDQQDFCYDNKGRLSFRTYPYQGSGFSVPKACSGNGDSFLYDALDRVTQVLHSDGGTILYGYSGRSAQITDEGNSSFRASRILQTDARGRLTNVCEVTSSTFLGVGGTPTSCGLDLPGAGLLTSYSYDTLDHLTAVAQGSATIRTSTYDSLSRLISESEPEWSPNSTAAPSTMSYSYNDDGLLLTRVRPAPNQTNAAVNITTNYSYDALHRMTGFTYANDATGTPGVAYNYDEATAWGTPLTNTIGRMSSQATGSPFFAGQIFSFDSMGRPTLNAQCTPRTCPSGVYNMHYQYDLLGDTISADNGVGVTFNYSYNVAGRITRSTSSLNDATHPGTLLSSAHYSPSGVLTDTLGNGVVENNGYFPRGLLQSVQINPANGVAGTGTINISGSLQSQSQVAAPGGGSVTISGAEKHKTTNPCAPAHRNCFTTIYDSGPVSVTVNGHVDQTTYGQNDDTGTIANRLAGVILDKLSVCGL